MHKSIIKIHILFIYYYIINFHSYFIQAKWSHPPFQMPPAEECGDNCMKCGGIFGDICIVCEPGYYLNSYGACEQCNNICLECSGPHDTECLSCKSEFDFFINGRCNKNTRQLAVVNNNIALPNASVNLGSSYFLYYQFNTDNTVDLYFVYNNNYWFGLGFGSDMDDVDMIIIENINGGIVVTDRFSTGDVTPSLDTSRGGTSDIELIEYSTTTSSTIAHVKRKLNTGDSNDFVMPGLGSYDLIWAYNPSGPMQSHEDGGNDNAIIATLDGTLNSASVENPESKARKRLLQAHGVIEFIIWGIIAEVGAYIPTIFRHIPGYLLIHSICFWIVYLLNWVGHILVFVDMRNQEVVLSEMTKLYQAHFALGIITLIIGTSQMIGGIIGVKKLQNYYGTEDFLKSKKIHAILGLVVSLIAKINLCLGVKLSQKDGEDEPAFPLIIIYVHLLVVIRIIVKIIFKKLKKKEPTKLPPLHIKTTDEQSDLLQQVNIGTPSNEIKKMLPNIKWVIMEGKIVDLTKYDHPGGNFIIQELCGRDVARFMYGSYALEKEKTMLTQYNHSCYAFNLLNSKVIGYLNKQSFMPIIRDKSCKLATHDNLTPTTSKFIFTSSNLNVSNHAPGVSWMGSYFKIYSMSDTNKKRLYTTVLCMTDENVHYRNALINFHNENLTGKTPAFAISKEIKIPKNSIPFIIKKYNNQGALSKFLHEAQQSKSVNFGIEGPFGRGLELTAQSTGRHIIFAAGTGILPFLDLLNYMLMAAIFNDLKARGLDDSKINELNVFNEDYEKGLDPSFSVELYASFPNEKEILGIDIIEKLCELNRKSSEKSFTAYIRGYAGKFIQDYNKRFDESLVQSLASQPFDKIYICGSPEFNRVILLACKELEIEDKVIML